MTSLITDKDIENLERIRQVLSEVKQTLKEIREIDNNFSLSNVIEADKESILIVTTKQNYCKNHIDFIEEDLQNRIGVRCVLIPEETKIEKAINIKKDNKQEKDYETITSYDERGNIIKEESTYYK